MLVNIMLNYIFNKLLEKDLRVLDFFVEATTIFDRLSKLANVIISLHYVLQ